ncbi:MAG: chemotaxis-specific protein-glutamate methyltransferase CheB [Planctomycetota bacterium]|nr:MAG: chemotaxis-specific protein-glutamate methyltransferase CheB [Planctomycetota bacterium]
MRVLVIDDSAFMRKMITRMIEETRGLEVVGQARNGREGVELAEKLKPDLITLDIEMPELDGLGALRQIRVRCRKEDPAVLMCSSLTTEGSAEALKALRLGAADVIAKDPALVGKNDDGFRNELITKLKTIGTSRSQRRRAGAAPTEPGQPIARADAPPPKDIDLAGVDAVLIGSSTGGPPVLEDILAPLPAGLRVPVFVAQHMPAVFTKTLASRLDQHCANGARLITEPTMIERPGIYVAEGGRHLHLENVRGGIRAEMRTEPADALYRPSVNVLFSTGAKAFRGRVLGIQLTGMGDDGAKGAADLRRAGGRVIAQHESTCVVYGMPKAVVESGQADGVMTPSQIAGVLTGLCGPAGSRRSSEEFRKSA